MIRTQIQLTEDQAAELRQLSDRQDISIAELIRRAVDQLLRTSRHASESEQQNAALAFIGQYPDPANDLSDHHDQYLADIGGYRSGAHLP